MLGPCLWCGSCCPFSFSNHLSGEEIAGCLTLIVLRQSVFCVSSERRHVFSLQSVIVEIPVLEITGIKLELILKLKIKCNDWLPADSN